MVSNNIFNNKERQKRLGQYFTGMKLAKLLAILAEAESCQSVIDPMAGIGDMLLASAELGNKQLELDAIEIDPYAFEELSRRINNSNVKSVNVLLGSAFDIEVMERLKRRKWDLVITNPPYVRYQSFSKEINAEVRLDSSTQIRQKLKYIINNCTDFNKVDLDCFNIIIDSYSGLSDLAVPSWILCSALVKKEGILAMVVPESWLNRDYSHIVQYLLLKCFKIKYVVEDADSTWFNTAQVKTNLIIAERIETRESILDFDEREGYLKIRLTNKVADINSLVGNLYVKSTNPEKCFLEDVKSWLKKENFVDKDDYSITFVSFKDIADNITKLSVNKKWFNKLEKSNDKREKNINKSDNLGYFLPHEIYQQVIFKDQNQFKTLEQIGVNVGQGLRTGANTFFYVDCVKSNYESVVVKPNPIFNIKEITVPQKCLEVVLRKQSELNSSYEIDINRLDGRVLVFNGTALKDDIDRAIRENQCTRIQMTENYDIMSKELEYFVKKAALTNVGTTDETKLIPTLSAVAPNIKNGSKNKLPKFWYMLPDFSERHRPNIAIPRINNFSPKAVLNRNKKCIVDANFSTLWISKESCIDEWFLLALLNSTWIMLNMELSATVMGGGALKLEAAHLRRLPIPNFNDSEYKKLSLLGKQLSKIEMDNSKEIKSHIDKIIFNVLFNKEDVNKYTQLLKVMIDKKLKDRRKG